MPNNQIVARYQDGRVLKGIALDIDPARPTFHVRPAPGQALTVKLAELKAVFFVRSLDGNPEHKENLRPNLHDARGRASRLITLHFADGETMVGHTIGNPMNRPYFYIVPVDAASNNTRIMVNRDALVSME